MYLAREEHVSSSRFGSINVPDCSSMTMPHQFICEFCGFQFVVVAGEVSGVDERQTKVCRTGQTPSLWNSSLLD